MLRSVWGHGLWERRTSTLWWLVALLALTGWIVAFYPAIRDSAEIQEFITDFPPELLALFGIDPELFTTGFGYLQAQLYSLIGPIVVIGLAIGIGSAATAGEEERGTMDLLLSVPLDRTRLVIDKYVTMAALVAAAAALMAVVLAAANPLVDLRLSIAGIVGVNMGLALLGLVFGSLAMAISAWRGSRPLAAGLALTAAAATWFVDGFAPVVDALDTVNRFLPFDWYLRGDPLQSGPTLHHLLLAALAGGFGLAAVRLFRRRDIGTHLAGPWSRLLHRSGRTDRPAGRLDGLLDGLFGKALWERRRSIWWWLAGLGALAALTIAFWPTVERGGDDMQALLDAVPEAMLAMFGITDPDSLLTPEGFLSARLYASIGAILVLVFAIGAGTGALAGEERAGTMDLLLGTPADRDRVAMARIGALGALVAFLMAGLWVVVVVAGAAVDMGLDSGRVALANAGLGLLGLFFGMLAAAVGAATGRPGAATGAAAGLAVFAFVLNGFGAALDWLGPARWASPFFWFLRDSSPASRGFTPTYLLLLLGALVGAGAAVVAFRRRDVGT